MAEVKRKPVPWKYSENAIFKNWLWETPHFIVKIIGEGDITEGGAVFTWSISEKTERGTFIFESSTNRSFREAESEIVEIIAKSWKPQLGYGEYAGDLATTFTISGGKRLNFNEFSGEQVSIVFKNNGTEETRTGQLAIRHYKILVKLDNDKVIEIPPALIKSVEKRVIKKSYLT